MTDSKLEAEVRGAAALVDGEPESAELASAAAGKASDDPAGNAAGGQRHLSPLSRRVMVGLGLVCIASLVGHLALLPQMPEMIPTHWDAAGNVNGWTDRTAIIALDALPLLLLLMLRYLPAMDPRGQIYARMGSFYAGFVTLFTLFMVGITWTSELTVFGLLPQSGSPVGAITSVVIGAGLVLLGNYMPKVKRNYTFGCKTPWALDNDVNWRLTHRFCGVAFVLSGITTVVSGVLSLQYGELAFWMLITAVLGASLATYAYSYLVYRNGNKPLRTR